MLSLKLPRPPSVNGMYATNWKTKQRFKSKKYGEWLKQAQAILLQQMPVELFSGEVTIDIFVSTTNRKEDISNRIKAVEDFLVTSKIIKDDSLVTSISCTWDSDLKNECCVNVNDNSYLSK
jgi:Holliday junction resolvase RusA-like endonuclease